MKNWKVLTIVAVLFSIVIAGSVGYALQKSEERYKQDVQRLNTIAKKLGYSQGSHLNFYRSSARGIDGDYDVLKLLFASEIPHEKFVQLVDTLHFQGAGPSTSEDGFLYNSWDVLKSKLLLQSKGLNGRKIQPVVTEWILIDGLQKKTFTIDYAEPKAANSQWDYNGRRFDGAVVEVKLDRL